MDSALPDVARAVSDAEIHPPLPSKEVLHSQCADVFRWLDVNGDGKLSTSELQVGSCGCNRMQHTKPTHSGGVGGHGSSKQRSIHPGPPVPGTGPFSCCSRVLRYQRPIQYDSDNDGAVTFTEFCSYVERKERTLWHAFRRLDVDGNGHLDRAEVQRAFKGLGMAVEPDDVSRLLRLLDENKDERISYPEFKRFALLLPANQVRGRGILVAMLDSADWYVGDILPWGKTDHQYAHSQARINRIPTLHHSSHPAIGTIHGGGRGRSSVTHSRGAP